MFILERQTYSLLDWLGDVGGLYDGLGIVVGAFVSTLSSIRLKNKLLDLVFKPSGSDDEDDAPRTHKGKSMPNELG